jgi:hypothetical protein
MPTSASFTQVSSCGTPSGCGLQGDGGLTCWGAEDVGLPAPPEGSFTQVSCGLNHACARRDNGTIACWGQKGQVHAAGWQVWAGQFRRYQYLRHP